MSTKLRKNKKIYKNKNNKASSYRVEAKKGNQLGAADSEIVDMPWTDDGLTAQSALTSYLNFRYRGNSPFDPNPNVGGTSALYFATYALLYRRYRVLSVVVEYEIVNNEAFPVHVAMAPTAYDISGSITSNINAANVGELPYARKPRLLAAKGGQDRLRDRILIHWPTFVGNKQSYYADITYASLNNNNPAVPMFLQFACYAQAALTLGVSANVRIVYRTLWSEFNYETTLFKQLSDKTIPERDAYDHSDTSGHHFSRYKFNDEEMSVIHKASRVITRANSS